MTPSEDIISKIRKLLALSQSGNEHESALAAQRAQELLSVYNLTMTEIDAASQKANAQEVPGGKRGKQKHDAAAMYKYQRTLMSAVAECNFCYHLLEKRWKKDPKGSQPRWHCDRKSCDGTNDSDKGRYVDAHTLIGRDVNVMAAQIMYDYLIETMDRVLPYQGMQKRGREALLWLEGCTARLSERLQEKKREMVRESNRKAAEMPQGGGIVLASVFASEDDYNTDIRCGYDLGFTAASRAKNTALYRSYKQKEEELVSGGMSAGDAYYVARGFSIPEPEPEPPPMTAKEREKANREQARWDAKWERKENKEKERTSHRVYRAGEQSGEDIGLDQQVTGGNQKGIK